MPGPLEAVMAAHSGGGAAVEHVDGGDFAFGLQEDAAGLREVEGSGFGDLAGGGDGIAVKGAAARQDRAFHDGFVAFHQLCVMAIPLGRCATQHRYAARLGTGEETDATAGAARAQVFGG